MTSSTLALFLCAGLTLVTAQFKCPEKFGLHPDSKQCDKYYECDEGVATEKLCPDGLVFDPLNRKINKCDQPFNVDCGDRVELQEPHSNHNCPRKNGYFAHPDESVCHIFFNCIDGDPVESKCPTGLHFDEYSGTCVWPAAAGRTGCGEKQEALKDGFSCPKEAMANEHGQVLAHPKYAHPQDCQKFYVCLNGVSPREQGCPLGEVYSVDTQRCEEPEDVPGCENFYKDHPRFKELFHDSDGDGKKDFGKKRVFH